MTEGTAEIVEAFTDATNRHDVAAMLALVSDDIVFESTTPPDGERLVGKDALRSLWEGLFRDSPNARVETEELVVRGNRCTVLLRYVFDDQRPQAGHVRAVDVLRVDDGKLVEKLSYVKG